MMPRVRKIPEWQRASLRDIQWRIALGMAIAWLVMVAGAVALNGTVHIPWSLLLIAPPLVASVLGVIAAYHRGVRDGRAHPEDANESAGDDLTNRSSQPLTGEKLSE